MIFIYFFFSNTISSDISGFIRVSTQLEIAQKHPDIYAVPVKLPKPNLNRPQPIGWEPVLSVWDTLQLNQFLSELKLNVCRQVQCRATGDAQAAVLRDQRTRGQGGGVPAPAVRPGQEGTLQPSEIQRHWAVRCPEPGSEPMALLLVTASLNSLLAVTFPAETSTSTLISDFYFIFVFNYF